jgi:hypothetical protein
MIINIRGTHGAGKSTAVLRILKKFPHTEFIEPFNKKGLGYTVKLPNGETLGVVGRYNTACGGADGIQPYSDIWPRVERFAKAHDHVLFEGALVSVSYGSIGLASEAFGDDFVFAFMDTPLDRCISQVNKRRAEAGKPPLADPKNIEGKFMSCLRLASKLTNGDQPGIPKRRVAWIDCCAPAKTTLKLLGIKIKEPS